VGTILQDTPPSNDDRNPRWDRVERAELCAQYGNLQAQGISQRQAAKVLLQQPTNLIEAVVGQPVAVAYQDQKDIQQQFMVAKIGPKAIA
jgi:regulatory protein YycI of two-component signal transduction system YycFG